MNLLRVAAVFEARGFVTPGVLERVRQNRHALKGALGVNARRERENIGGEPRGFERN